MAEPLLSEDTDLARLISTIRAEHGDSAAIIYHDTVRRGGVLGFFAREVHRVAYQLIEDEAGITAAIEADPAAIDAPATDDPATDNPQTDNPAADNPAADTEVDAAAGIEAAHDEATAAFLTRTAELETLSSTATEFRAALAAATAAEVATDNTTTAIDELLAAADADEARTTEPAVGPEPTSIFSDRLTRHRSAGALAAATPLARLAEPSDATVTPIAAASARGRLDVLMQLRSLGVPVGINPRTEAHDIYQALEEVLAEVGAPPPVPRSAGEIIALVGPLTPALRTAQDLADQLRIPRAGLRFAGLAGHPVESLMTSAIPVITGTQEARLLRSDLRTSGLVSIIVIATDSTEGDPTDEWAADILAALQPTAAWAIVDATAKLDDEQERLARLGPIDALAVHSASLSASPATVWDLGHPVALVDGRPATAFTWSSLLFGVLTVAPRHRSTA
jgi:hypothetical protein